MSQDDVPLLAKHEVLAPHFAVYRDRQRVMHECNVRIEAALDWIRSIGPVTPATVRPPKTSTRLDDTQELWQMFELDKQELEAARDRLKQLEPLLAYLKEIERRCQAYRSRGLATLFAFLLGTFGVHSFYLGYHKRGCLQLLFFLLGTPCIGYPASCYATPYLHGDFLQTIGPLIILLLPLIMSVSWNLYDGVRLVTGAVKCDAQDNPLN